MNSKKGIDFSVAGGVDEAHLVNIDRLKSANHGEASAARLNREIINVLDTWLETEDIDEDRLSDLIAAAMHGVLTICGTILIRLPPRNRKQMLKVMRKYLFQVFDDMGKAALREG